MTFLNYYCPPWDFALQTIPAIIPTTSDGSTNKYSDSVPGKHNNKNISINIHENIDNSDINVKSERRVSLQLQEHVLDENYLSPPITSSLSSRPTVSLKHSKSTEALPIPPQFKKEGSFFQINFLTFNITL